MSDPHERQQRMTEVRLRLYTDAAFAHAVDLAEQQTLALLDLRLTGQEREVLRWAAALALEAAEALRGPLTPASPAEAATASPSPEIEPFDVFIDAFEAGRARGGWEAEVSPEPEPPDLDEAMAAWKAASEPHAAGSEAWEAMQQRAREAGLRPGEVINDQNLALARLRREPETPCTCGRRLQPLPISGRLLCPPCGYERGRCLCDVLPTEPGHRSTGFAQDQTGLWRWGCECGATGEGDYQQANRSRRDHLTPPSGSEEGEQ